MKRSIDKQRFDQSIKQVRLFSFIAGMFNLFLIIPDLINIGDTAALYVISLRVGYAVLVIAFVYVLKKIKRFFAMAILVTLMEIMAIVQFLIVLKLYPSPDFTIQLLGIIILLVYVVIVPNYLSLTLIVTCFGAAAFIGLAASVFSQNAAQLVPSAVYLGLLIIAGAVYKGYSLRNQKQDFIRISRMEYAWETDPLTKISNRNALNGIENSLVEELIKKDRSLSLIFMDVDDLKRINDAFGHKYGDQFLREIAETVRSQLRREDICIRWGGDEFVLVLPDVNLPDATNLAKRIQQALLTKKQENNIVPSCSFGIAVLKPGQTLEALITEADRAMYEVKRNGKNNIAVSEASTAF
jgi:diguanylate cyclase (GGDEF)-like protein